MRGKVSGSLPKSISEGITPAYAGKRASLADSPPAAKDHPRLCGEKAPILLGSVITAGSPPPMRGKEIIFPAFSGALGITPAYAGKRLPECR